MVINSSRILLAVAALAFLLLGAISAKKIFAAFANQPVTLENLQLLPAPKPVPHVMLRTVTGDAFVRERFENRWSLVFFGFTFCPDYCPLELQKLAKLLMWSEQENVDLQIIFVSVDPERDSAEHLAKYVNYFHPAIVGLRGDNPAVANFARFFGAAYERSAIINGRVLNVPAGSVMPSIAGEQYQVNHSTRVFVIDPQGQYIGSVVNVQSPELLWSDLRKLF